MPMNSCRFLHVGLTCKSVTVTQAFYEAFLGFQFRGLLKTPERVIVFIRLGSIELELFEAETSEPIPLPMADGYPWPGYRHMAFEVNDFEAFTLKLKTDGVPITLGPLEVEPGWHLVWFSDPDGRIVEISSHKFEPIAPVHELRA